MIVSNIKKPEPPKPTVLKPELKMHEVSVRGDDGIYVIPVSATDNTMAIDIAMKKYNLTEREIVGVNI